MGGTGSIVHVSIVFSSPGSIQKHGDLQDVLYGWMRRQGDAEDTPG